jgi:cyclopropane fatty-acyl-phospholipid synthase-like methyltransferase
MKIYLILFFSISIFAKDPISLSRLNQLSGDKSSSVVRKSAWNDRYNKKSYVYGKAPAKFLAENFGYLKAESKVLDMGMGEGRNAVFLAQKGHSVIGVDISSVAIKKAKRLSKELGVKIKTVEASLDKYVIKKESFDAIVCFYYLDRTLIDKMKMWLKPGGLIIFEAHSIKERKKKFHQRNPEEYYLKDNELLSLFKGMEILKYEAPIHENEFRMSIIVKKD